MITLLVPPPTHTHVRAALPSHRVGKWSQFQEAGWDGRQTGCFSVRWGRFDYRQHPLLTFWFLFAFFVLLCQETPKLNSPSMCVVWLMVFLMPIGNTYFFCTFFFLVVFAFKYQRWMSDFGQHLLPLIFFPREYSLTIWWTIYWLYCLLQLGDSL